jgi:hypothetical protein
VTIKYIGVRAKAVYIKGSIFSEKLLMHRKERIKIKAKTLYIGYWFRINRKRY